MTEKPRHSGERPSADQAPELYNDEQEDELDQAHQVAREARARDGEASPLDSVKPDEEGEPIDNSAQDLVDRMRDMEQSGRIDMGAYRGEPNLDDNEDKYDEENREDDLPSDGS